MEEFLRFYDSIKNHHRGWSLEIYYSSILDWNITVGYSADHPWHGRHIIHVQDCDRDLAFAKAQVLLKEWLLDKEGGY
ncbi:hypothetical protein [Paenibacillus medicaginis]|uniref:Phage protein n=1 Tax=Paenibacillus medicaginis TaxID=1470560 RepID=A0ABV5BV26_9BACL